MRKEATSRDSPLWGGTAPERAWRFCVLRTLRDTSRAAKSGKPMTRPNAERLFCRRWADVEWICLGMNDDRVNHLRQAGRLLVRLMWDRIVSPSIGDAPIGPS